MRKPIIVGAIALATEEQQDGPTPLDLFVEDLKQNPPPYRKAHPCRCEVPDTKNMNLGKSMLWCQKCDRFHSWAGSGG